MFWLATRPKAAKMAILRVFWLPKVLSRDLEVARGTKFCLPKGRPTIGPYLKQFWLRWLSVEAGYQAQSRQNGHFEGLWLLIALSKDLEVA